MVRVDMSEFMEKHSVSRLIGAPPGYVGYDEGGYLTEAVRRRPYCVILLDEIEKAHPDVFNVLLQVLDDGRMTDGKGRTVDFKNTIMIMTSNLGSSLIMKMAEEMAGESEIRQRIEEILHEQFKPEFLNRIDETIIFKSLSRENLIGILDIQLNLLNRRLKARNITLHIRQSAKQLIIDLGYNPSFGARPLKRAIQRHLEDPLAMHILDGTFNENEHILVEAEGSQMKFTKHDKS